MATKNSIGNYPLSVPEGGTGRSTLVQNGILVGEGSSAINSIGGEINGQLFMGSNSSDPAWANLTSNDNTVTITSGINSLTLSAASTGNLQSWTPTFFLTGTQPSFSYFIRSGQYIQIGNIIYFNFRVNLNSFSGGTGSPYITGLPGTMDTSIGRYYFSNFFDFMGGAVATFGEFFDVLDTSTGRISAIQLNTTTNNPAITRSQMTAVGNVWGGSGYYFIL